MRMKQFYLHFISVIVIWVESYTLLHISFPGISPSGISELDWATTKTDTAERIISIGRESLQVFFVLGALTYLKVPQIGGSHDEEWRSQWISKRLCHGICQNWVNCDCATEVSDHVPHRNTYRQNNSWMVHEFQQSGCCAIEAYVYYAFTDENYLLYISTQSVPRCKQF